MPLPGLCAWDCCMMSWITAFWLSPTARLAYMSLTSMVVFRLAFDERQEFAAQVRVLEEGAVHDTVDHFRVHVLDPAPLHAEMVRFHDHGQTVRLHFFLQQVGQLDHGFFL